MSCGPHKTTKGGGGRPYNTEYGVALMEMWKVMLYQYSAHGNFTHCFVAHYKNIANTSQHTYSPFQFDHPFVDEKQSSVSVSFLGL